MDVPTRRPNRVAALLNRADALLGSSGLGPNRLVTLEVRGCRSGRLTSRPVVVADYQGERYLVAMLGQDANWVRNVRAAGGRVVLRHGRSEAVRLEEVDPRSRAPILRRYLEVAPGARAHIPVDRHAPPVEFERIAARYPRVPRARRSSPAPAQGLNELDEPVPEVEAGMSRGRFLRRAGLGIGTLAVAGAGALGYRAYDQGVLEVGEGPAYEPWSSWQDGEGLLPLVGAATLAPSPHNAQAWLFGVGRNQIDLYADRARKTGAIDPLGREMYVGLGAALENLVLAARAGGFAPTVTPMPAGPESTHAARVVLSRSARLRSELYAQIPRRHTNRYAFVEGKAVPRAALAAMAGLAGTDLADARLFWFTGASERGRIGELFVSATEAIVADPDQSASDYEWFRQDWDELQRQRDGITVDAAGLTDLTAALAKLLPPQSQEATGEAWLTATRERHTKTAAGYGIVAVRDAADNRQRLEGGRVLERVHLWAAGHDLALHHMNQLTERADREAQLGLKLRFGDALRELLPSDWQALASFRIGHPTQTPNESPRRPVEAVIVS